MSRQRSQSYIFGYRAIDDAVPRESGVYAIFGTRRSIYVGESDDIRQSLFRHLNNRDTAMARYGPLTFSFELSGPAERLTRKKTLLMELQPVWSSPPRETSPVELS